VSNPVRKLREALGWNRVKFAAAIGKSHQRVQNYEDGAKLPVKVAETIRQLARQYDLEHLLDDLEKAEPVKISAMPHRKYQRWHDLLDEVLAGGDQKAAAMVEDYLNVLLGSMREKKRRVRKKRVAASDR